MSKNGVQGLVESHIQERQRRQEALVRGWSKHINAIDEHLKSKQGRTMTDIEKMNVAQCLENALDYSARGSQSSLFEATTEDSVKFLGIQLPVIAALLPSLALNEIASVQALDRRQGAVFYLDVQYGSDKGEISKGDSMLSALTGHARGSAQRQFASTLVKKEATGIDTTGSYTVEYCPGVDVTSNRKDHPERTIVLRDGDGSIVASDSYVYSGAIGDHAGSLRDTSNREQGTITAAGVLTISGANISTASGDGYTVDYCYQYDLPTNTTSGIEVNRKGVPEANVAMASSTVTALDFPIRSKYSLGAAIDVQRAHGINLESEITKYLGGEVRFTIDHFGIDLIEQAATGAIVQGNPFASDGANVQPAAPITAWNAAINTGQEWLWKKQEFNDRVEQGNVNIIERTLRGMATFIVAGNNVARVIRQLPNFKPASVGKTPPTGPYKMGMLDNRVVIHDPFLSNSNRYIMGYKGDSFLLSGFAYCPYIPLLSTPTLVTSDLFAQKGFLSAAGFKILNAGMYTYGDISGLGTAAAVNS